MNLASQQHGVLRASRISLAATAIMIGLMLLLASCAAPAAAPPAPPTAAPAAAPAPAPAATAPPVPLVILTPTPIPRGAVTPPTPAPRPGEQAQYGGVLTIGHFGTPPHLDIHQVDTAGTLWAVGPAYSSLLQFDPHKNIEIVPDLAERWEGSGDAKTFTFFLRKGVKWHDGKPFTAEDVVFSFERIRAPPKGAVSPRQSLLANVSKLEKLDEATVRFTLAEPQASFVPVIAQGWMAVMPKHIIEAKGDMKNDVVGTGPFKLKRYQRGISVELEKNPDYFVKGLPYLDGVTHYIIVDWNTRFAALRAKRILMTNPGIPGLTTDMRLILEREMSDRITTAVHTYLGFIYTVMNVNKKPFDDVRVRKAIDLALDRKAANDTLQQGAGLPGYMMPPGTLGALAPEEIDKMPGYRRPKDQDVAEAKSLLADAGFPTGFDVPMLNRAGPAVAPRGIFMADQLKKIGIQARVDTKEDASFFNDLFNKTYAIITTGEVESVGDPDNFLRQYFHSKGSKNRGGFVNVEIDSLIEKQSRTLDMTERAKIAQDIQLRLLRGHYPVAHILHLVGQMGWWKDVRNYVAPIGVTNNVQYRDVWLAK
ncbi:MAG: ABC transporter substrate-binding protein [Chloroflexi bacterium]|nr:ABC transporter substrate-binding protein [Chloroflexota bacterium]